jgi:Prohead core protein serine protease
MPLLLTEVEKVRIQNEGAKVFVEGIYLQSETLNKNNRIYPRRVLESAVDSLQDKIRNRELFGELSHSNETSVNLSRASHIIESLQRKGNDWFGRSRVIDEGNGRILKSILDCGGRIGMSSRGFGSLQKNQQGHHVVQEDYRMITADAVSDPSAPGAYMNAVHEAIRSGKLNLMESATAMKIIKETEALASVQRSDGSSSAMDKYDQDEFTKDCLQVMQVSQVSMMLEPHWNELMTTAQEFLLHFWVWLMKYRLTMQDWKRTALKVTLLQFETPLNVPKRNANFGCKKRTHI